LRYSFCDIRLTWSGWRQAAFARSAEVGGARRAPQDAVRSAAAAAKPLLFRYGFAVTKGAPRPRGSFCRPALEAGNLHFPCDCGVAAEWERLLEIESREADVAETSACCGYFFFTGMQIMP